MYEKKLTGEIYYDDNTHCGMSPELYIENDDLIEELGQFNGMKVSITITVLD